MKKIIALAASLVLAVSLISGCGVTETTAGSDSAAATPLSESTQSAEIADELITPELTSILGMAEETFPVATPDPALLETTGTVISNRILPNKPFLRNIDGAGEDESVQLIYIETDEIDSRVMAVVVTYSDGTSSRHEIRYQKYVDAYEYVTADGVVYMFVCGDYDTEDYEVNVLKLTMQSIEVVSTVCGTIEKIENDVVYIGDVIDLLGPHRASRPYVFNEEGFAPVEDSFWTYTEDVTMSLSQDITFDVVEDGNYVTTTVKAGEPIKLLSTDRDSFLNVRLADGREGVIEFVSDEYGFAVINGFTEAELFEDLPYAG